MAYLHLTVLVILVTPSVALLDLCEPNCSNICSFPGRFYETCRCDPLCKLYGDCCSEASRALCDPILPPPHPPFTCQDSNSITVTDNVQFPPIITDSFFWYWMVTACPDSWTSQGESQFSLEFRHGIDNMCVNTTQRLPPVSDMVTGFDYRNEFCAFCNTVQPENIVRWEYDYQCQPEYREVIQATANYTFTEDDLEMYCFPKRSVKPSFNLMSTGLPSPPPRPCYPIRPQSCLDRDTLVNTTAIQVNESEYNSIKSKCLYDGSQAPVTQYTIQFLLPFRNRYCAICNGFPDDNFLSCFAPNIMTGIIGPDLSLEPFSVFLDINRDGRILVSSEVISTTIQVACSSYEIYDPILRACRSTILQDCIQNATAGLMIVLVDGTCITVECKAQLLAINNSTSFTFHNSTFLNYEGTVYPIEYTNNQNEPVICFGLSSNDSLETICNTSLISLSESDLFTYTSPNSVIYGDEVYEILFNSSNGEPVICVDFSINGTQETNTTIEYYGYPVGFFILTYIGCSLSVIGCSLILITYTIFNELRTLPSEIIMNLAVAILITNLFILLGGPVTGAFPDVIGLCVSVAILLHFFCLSQFSWMCIISMEMVRTFYRAYQLRMEETKSSKRTLFVIYFITGWTLPLLVTVVTIAVNFSTNDLVLYGTREDGTRGSCWINHVESAIVAFIVPVALSLIFNTITFVIVAIFLINAHRTQAKMNKTNNQYYRVAFAVFSVSGLTWGFGFVAILLQTGWSWYPFIILNSVQGFVIFVTFICTKRIAKLYWSLFTCKETKKTSSTIGKNATQLNKISSASKLELKLYRDGTTF